MKVALVHDWLVSMRGGERCLEVMCELFPDADVFTLVHRKGQVSPVIEKHSIRTSFVQQLPFSLTHYQYYLPFFPFTIGSFAFHDHDLIVSSSHCVANLASYRAHSGFSYRVKEQWANCRSVGTLFENRAPVFSKRVPFAPLLGLLVLMRFKVLLKTHSVPSSPDVR